MAHRKIDVDKFDEDQYVEDVSNSNEKSIEDTLDSRISSVKSMLARGEGVKALSLALDNPPTGSASQSAKDKNTGLVMETVQAIKTGDIPSAIQTLDQDKLELLMRYVYRGMASPELYNASALLLWHEKILEATGLGCIVRVISERRTV